MLRPLRTASGIALVTAAVLAIGLAHGQGTLQRLPDYPVALAVRGEDWRAANAWVRSNAEPTDLIFLDAGLVEARGWLELGDGSAKYGNNFNAMSPPVRQPTSRQLDYLVFPVNGPYDVGVSVLPTTLGSQLQPYELPSDWSAVLEAKNAASRVIVITRQPANRINPSFRLHPFKSPQFWKRLGDRPTKQLDRRF